MITNLAKEYIAAGTEKIYIISNMGKKLMAQTILLTGVAGFIGMHTAKTLLKAGHKVIGVDAMNSYYDPALKQARLQQLSNLPNFTFIQLDLAEPEALARSISTHGNDITHVIHLAAQAGVRYSLEAPRTYISSNICGTVEILELCRSNLPNLQHLVYASSSSVYGTNKEQPFSPQHRTDNPVSLYAATKKSCEILTESYSKLYNIPATGLRFFTVYGPWGRPDMAYFKFTQSILGNKTIQVYNNGDMRRDFTYIDDIVSGILSVMQKPPTVIPPHKIYNLGNSNNEALMDMIRFLEEHLDKKAVLEMLPMQAGDVYETFADITESTADFGFMPQTKLKDGLAHFTNWYREFYKDQYE